jgi:hypothetical protein
VTAVWVLPGSEGLTIVPCPHYFFPAHQAESEGEARRDKAAKQISRKVWLGSMGSISSQLILVYAGVLTTLWTYFSKRVQIAIFVLE